MVSGAIQKLPSRLANALFPRSCPSCNERYKTGQILCSFCIDLVQPLAGQEPFLFEPLPQVVTFLRHMLRDRQYALLASLLYVRWHELHWAMPDQISYFPLHWVDWTHHRDKYLAAAFARLLGEKALPIARVIHEDAWRIIAAPKTLLVIGVLPPPPHFLLTLECEGIQVCSLALTSNAHSDESC